MNCEIYGGYMMKHFDGDINDIESAQLKNHLKMCMKCKGEFEELQEILCDVHAACVVEPPPDFEEKVMNRINDREIISSRRSNIITGCIHSIATIALAVLTMSIVNGIERINIFSSFGRGIEYFASISGAVSTLSSIIDAVARPFVNIMNTVFRVLFMFTGDSYFVFLVLIAMLFIIGKITSNLIKHSRGGA